MTTKSQVGEYEVRQKASLGKQLGAAVAIGTLMVMMLSGFSWIFGIRETALDASKTAQGASAQVQELSKSLAGKADKADVQQMKLELREDLRDIKHQLLVMSGGTDVTWVKRPPKVKRPIHIVE